MCAYKRAFWIRYSDIYIYLYNKFKSTRVFKKIIHIKRHTKKQPPPFPSRKCTSLLNITLKNCAVYIQRTRRIKTDFWIVWDEKKWLLLGSPTCVLMWNIDRENPLHVRVQRLLCAPHSVPTGNSHRALRYPCKPIDCTPIADGDPATTTKKYGVIYIQISFKYLISKRAGECRGRAHFLFALATFRPAHMRFNYIIISYVPIVIIFIFDRFSVVFKIYPV